MKGFLKLLLINAMVLLGISGVIEIILRFFPPDWLQRRMDTFIDRTGGERQGEFGSDSSWKIEKKDGKFVSFTPNSSLLVSHQEYLLTAHINDRGLRAMPGSDKKSGKPIPVFGDSFVFGIGVEDGDTFLSLLQDKMDSCQVLNFGVPGSSLLNQLYILKARYPEFPGIRDVFFAFYLGNDFEDMIRADRLSRQAGKSSKEQKPGRNLLWEINHFINKSSFFNKSYLIQFIKVSLLQVYNRYGAGSKILLAGFTIMNEKEAGFSEQWKKAASRALTELRAMEDSLGFKSHFIVIPQKYKLNLLLLWELSVYYGVNFRDLDPERPARLITGLLREHGFDFLNLTSCIEKSGGAELYYIHDGHFNPAGSKVASDCLTSYFSSACLN